MQASEIYNKCRMFLSNYEYVLNNVYIYDWESDIFALSKTGYSTEIEVKISVNDFRKDFAKPKHELFKGRLKRWILHNKTSSGHICYYSISDPKSKIPNRFYFAVPEEIVDKIRVPDYAGLLVIKENGFVRIHKKAPLLHRQLHDFKERLLSKFYHRRNSALYDVNEALYQLDRMNDEDLRRQCSYLLKWIKRILE